MNTYTEFFQSFSEDVGALLLVDEDDDGRFDTASQDLHELVPLLVLVDHEDDLFSALDRFTGRTDVHRHGASQIRPRQTLHRRGHRRRKHHRLPEFVFRVEVGHQLRLVFSVVVVGLLVGDGHVVEDLLNVRFETHVNHTIGFVQYDVGALRQHQVTILQHVD